MTIYFDIETGPLPEAELEAILPPFDPLAVKCGNMKDPEKIAAKVAEAQASHKQDFIDGAALDATTGRVLAVGLVIPGAMPCEEWEAMQRPGIEWSALGEEWGFGVAGLDDEAHLLQRFWQLVGEVPQVNRMVGFNSNYFDLPFLIRRSWKLGVPVPIGIRRGRYWADEMVDLRDIWQLGNREARGNLGSIATHLGCGAKNGDGAEFARLWTSDRPKAIEYLRNDLELTVRVARKLGV